MEDTIANHMQIKHIRTIRPSTKKLSKIAQLCWSHNNRKLAAADSDGIVHLYDENGEKMDQFPTKPAVGKRAPKSYSIKGMAFSPDDTKIAIAQSDNVVFVYRIGIEWKEKKSICNKFVKNSSSVSCLCWPELHPFELVYGCLDGKVKVGAMKENKSVVLYDTGSPTVSLASSPDGHGIVSGHEDGSIHVYYFEDLMDSEVSMIGHHKISQHSCIPYCISWGASIVVAGQDRKVAFYARDGGLIRRFDSTSKDKKECSAITNNPSGHTTICCSFNRIRVFNVIGYLQSEPEWEEGLDLEIDGLYSITSAAWKPDGSRVVIGTLCGSIEMFDTCIKRRRQGEFEFTHVSPSQVIVKRLSSGTRIVLKSLFEETISKVSVSRDQYLIGYTPRTLLLGDLESCKLSEIAWQKSGKEKFFFDNPGVCMVYNVGEVSLIEYGINDVIGSFRTDHISTHLISARVAEQTRSSRIYDAESEKKVVAYLVDAFTISILDLLSSFPVAKINHDSKIDWLELNVRATKLLFRDKQRHLHLFDLKTQQRTTLLTYCSYVQWVPNSDVVVAQNRNDLCVWYSIDAPDRVTIVQIKGEVEEIVRAQGCTAVIVDEGPGTVNYDLDEGLIEFGSAIEDRNYERAAAILEGLNLTPETEAMWMNLSSLVMKEQLYHIAERCFSALGDISQARYLRKIYKEIKRIEETEEEGVDPLQNWKVKSMIAILNKDFKQAEQIYLEQGKIEDAMEMYKQVHKFEESINLAVEKGVPNAQEKKQKYIDWLVASKQEDKAARMYENDGQYVKAINLYLQGGFPASAANVVTKYGVTEGIHDKLLDTIADSLYNNSLYEKAAEFYSKRNLFEKAIDAFRRGKSFRGAVELAREKLPDLVLKLEEEWGDYLVQQKQLESAISHFIEAYQYQKAIDCAINSHQWTKAVQILDGVDPSVANNYYPKIARHYEELNNLPFAKKYYVKAGCYKEAMEMFERVGNWDEVQDIAESFMNDKEIAALYTNRANSLENKQKFTDAEKLYIKANEVDLAINMYKKNHMFDDMIRLVTKYRAGLLKEAHMQIAKQLESEGQLRQAEHHYLESDDWKGAVSMYRNNDKWDDAIRVAKSNGGQNSWKKVAWEWAHAIGGDAGGESGAKLLVKLGLVEEAIDYCIKRQIWDMAFDLARTFTKSKLIDVHLKYAMHLEDGGHFKQAEDEYLNAQSPKEAVEMYIHQSDWANAMRVSETHEPSLVNYVLERQAMIAFENGDFSLAEKLYIQAKKPEALIQKYKEASKYQDAKRIADTYLQTDTQREVASEWAENLDDHEDPAGPARMFAQSGEYSKAIDAYLSFDWKSMDVGYLETEWRNAISLASNHIQSRLQDVVRTVTKRLIELKRPKSAANIFVSVGSIQEAAEVLVNNKMFGDAFSIAKSNPSVLQFVQQQHKRFLMSSENPEDLIQGGNIDAAIEGLANRHEWDEAIKLAQTHQKNDAISKYTSKYATSLVQQKQYDKALQVLEQYGLPLERSMIPYYVEIIRHTIWTQSHNEHSVQGCRDMLLPLLEGFQQSMGTDPTFVTLVKLYNISHLLVVKSTCENGGLPDIYTRICISLLRYCDELNPEQVFYDAGTACRMRDWSGMAYIFFNRYLDIHEMIEEAGASGGSARTVELDNADFLETDIPYRVTLPEETVIDDTMHADVDEYILVECMDIEPGLRQRPCDQCGKDIYEACLVCPHCTKSYESCIVSGYPVLKTQRVQCTECFKPANKNDWNNYIMKCKTCPNCQTQQLTF